MVNAERVFSHVVLGHSFVLIRRSPFVMPATIPLVSPALLANIVGRGSATQSAEGRAVMRFRILDLDGSLPQQQEFMARCRPSIFAAREWGPSIRLACSFGRFRRFERHLATLFESAIDTQPAVTFYGSGDFHHVTLGLVRRLAMPINLLVLDNHPDWMRGVPFLHCGTWLYHAARLPGVKQIFHVGGDVDFDNYYQCMAPWRLLRAGRIIVFAATRRFHRGAWSAVRNEPVRSRSETPVCRDRIEQLLGSFSTELASRPLYLSLDKDVLQEKESVVNWDSGHLTLTEVCNLLDAFVAAARGKLAGLDIVGDWSCVRLQGWLRYLAHLTEHPALAIDASDAARRNEQTNLKLVDTILGRIAPINALAEK
jgi:hypothetical protein